MKDYNAADQKLAGGWTGWTLDPAKAEEIKKILANANAAAKGMSVDITKVAQETLNSLTGGVQKISPEMIKDDKGQIIGARINESDLAKLPRAERDAIENYMRSAEGQNLSYFDDTKPQTIKTLIENLSSTLDPPLRIGLQQYLRTIPIADQGIEVPPEKQKEYMDLLRSQAAKLAGLSI